MTSFKYHCPCSHQISPQLHTYGRFWTNVLHRYHQNSATAPQYMLKCWAVTPHSLPTPVNIPYVPVIWTPPGWFYLTTSSWNRNMCVCLMSILGMCSSKLIYIWTWQLALSESLGHLGPSFHLFSEFSFLGRDIDIATATSAALSEAFWIVTEALIQRRWCKCTRWGTRFQIKMKQLPSCRTVIFLSFFCQTLCHLKWYQLSSNSALALLSQFTIFLMRLPLSSAHIMNNKTDAWQYLWISSFSL